MKRREPRQLGAEALIELGELRDDLRQHDEHHADREDDQDARIDQRADDALAQVDDDLLIAQEAPQHAFEIAGALAGAKRGRVDRPERRRRTRRRRRRARCPTSVFSRTSVSTSLKRRFFCRSSMMSNDCRIGRPALTSASSSWLKSRKCSVEMILRAARQEVAQLHGAAPGVEDVHPLLAQLVLRGADADRLHVAFGDASVGRSDSDNKFRHC